ncbi:MAG: hypothetical protein IAF38_20700 [Bacteroidia bacterium]|nr:hypothetical protein [Bacteroidia bacterium]
MIFPDGFIDSIKCCDGFDESNFVEGHNLPAEISVRINPLKKTDQFNTSEKVLWCDDAYYLKEKPQFIFDPLLHAGCYYVQEASSMFLHHAIKSTVDLSGKVTALDLCAAPGGKSTLVSSLLNDKSLLVSNEVIRSRANILLENVIKWNPHNTVVTNNDPEHFKRTESFFDLMVVDAPCSGSGLFRKDANAMKEWNLGNVEMCASRQKRILADSIGSLKTGGTLFYSTCSFSEAENEEMLDWLCENFEMETLKIETKPEWKIVETQSKDHSAFGYRFYPGKARGEGFFIGALRKKSEDGRSKMKQGKRIEKPTVAEIALLKENLEHSDQFGFGKYGKEIFLYNKEFENEISFLRENLNVMSFGTSAGEIMREELIPSHALALSGFLNSSVEKVNVDLETAIKFLRRDEIKIPSIDKGWKIICYEGRDLGWIKSLGNRVNNYYPKEWRVLKRYEG